MKKRKKNLKRAKIKLENTSMTRAKKNLKKKIKRMVTLK